MATTKKNIEPKPEAPKAAEKPKKVTKKQSILPEKIARFEIRVSGSGGQGVLSTGMLLAEAIAIGDGRNVTQSQSYGPEARGGATRADIIISDSEIYFPECHLLDLLLAFTTEAYETYALKVRATGLVVVEEKAAPIIMGSARTLKVPFTDIAIREIGNPISANILSLGFLSSYTGIVSRQAIRDAVEDKFSESRHLESNLKAVEIGYALGEKYAKDLPIV